VFVSEVISLAARPPFDFAKSHDFLGGFAPSEGGQEITDGTLTKALRVYGQTLVFRARQSSAWTGIDVTLHSDAPLAENIQQAALNRIANFLSLDDDLAPLYVASEEDPAFAPVVAGLYATIRCALRRRSKISSGRCFRHETATAMQSRRRNAC
jgi:DNA-3-methyladenine glycosylase II